MFQFQRWRALSRKAKLMLVGMVVLVLGAGTWGTVFAYQSLSSEYHQDMALAQVGIEHLHNASVLLQGLQKNPFDAAAVARARQEFAASGSAFGQVEANLASFSSAGTLVPVVGGKLSSALRLLPLAIEVTQAGTLGCSILNIVLARFHNPLNAKDGGLTAVDMASITTDARHLLTIFSTAVVQMNQLQPGDTQLDPKLVSAVATFHKMLPAIQLWMNEAGGLLTALPSLLGVGKPANYLIELVDSSELRPTGGFIGNYGFATLSGGRLASAHITDVYLFDWPYEATGKRIAYPPQYAWFGTYISHTSWSFRDSNLDADFPTSARNSETNYALEGGTTPVQGVISITPALIQQMLAVAGPISVPEYHEVVTAQNLVDSIHYYQLGAGRQGNDVPSADGHSSVRKHFTELLSEHFMARIRQLPPSTMGKLVQVALNALRTKDIQVYINNSAAETLLLQSGLGANIQSPAGDGLFVVDTNIAPDKANRLITNTLNDQVTLDGNGNAVHHTTLSYAWLESGDVYGSLLYRDYLRVYLPPNGIITTQNGWEPRGTSTAFGREVLSGFYTLSYGQTHYITFVWTVPHAVTHDAQGWHYSDEIQRQAGANWTIHVRVTLPASTTHLSVWGGLKAQGRMEAIVDQSLTEDDMMGVDYA